MASTEDSAIGNATESSAISNEEHREVRRDPTGVAGAEPGSLEMSDLSTSRGGITQESLHHPASEQVESIVPVPASTTEPTDTANDISSVPQGDGVTSTARISSEESAIGPATERPLANVRSSVSTGSQLVITLLLHSTDTRHPYIITERYLAKRNIEVADNDPINLTVYNLKDLIWRDWRDDWETRPASPTSIRLIHMGRMLDDKAYLKDSRFTTGESPHVVHMSIKPQEAIDDEDARIAKGSTRDRADSQRSPRCRCVIM